MILLIKFYIPNMKNKAILVSFIAIFAIVLTLNVVTAAIVDINDVEVDDVSLVCSSADAWAGFPSEEVEVEVEFTAKETVSDVRVKIYIEGYRDEVSETTSRFNIVEGSKYVKRFTIRLPSTLDLDEDPEDLSLIVRISAKGEDSFEDSYAIKMQKDSYSLNFLSIDSVQKAVAGDVIALDVVVENNGHEELENIYVRASIPELGVDRRVYVGDLFADNDAEYDNRQDDDDDDNDAVSKRIYLTLPRDTIPGIYDIEVEAYNYDAGISARKSIVVSGVDSSILSAVTSKSVSVGEETIYDLVIVNPSDRMVVYTITPQESTGLIVDVTEPIVTVSADSSRTVKIRVKATESVDEGTHLITVNVNSESGLVKQVNFTANVEDEGRTTDTVFVLTVILAIIFVVLLIVLIALLTKKPAETEEFGETSYY